MKRCAFLTCRSLEGYIHDDHLAVPCFEEIGWAVETVAWDVPTDWTRFDAVLIRTPWDYTERVDQFISTMESIERTGVPLWNPASSVRWNARKTYLLELEQKGIAIVPTVYSAEKETHRAALAEAFEKFGHAGIICKPIVGAGSSGIQRMASASEAIATSGPVFLQPFLPQIVERGELSLIFFEHEHSHTLRKIPKAGDFRSQEEFGSDIRAEKPSPAMLEAAGKVLSCLPEAPLYSRVDFIESAAGEPLLMELELIEPALYFRTDPGAARRLAKAFARRYTETVPVKSEPHVRPQTDHR